MLGSPTVTQRHSIQLENDLFISAIQRPRLESPTKKRPRRFDIQNAVTGAFCDFYRCYFACFVDQHLENTGTLNTAATCFAWILCLRRGNKDACGFAIRKDWWLCCQAVASKNDNQPG